MGIRIGVDVGGTFTKAVAVDAAHGALVAQAVLPTTHTDPRGVAAGVVAAVTQVAAEVGADRVELVTHSTTQAVNALLEGDVGAVGVVGLGRRPELARARKRTQLARVALTPDRQMRTVPAFLDVTDGLDAAAAGAVLDQLEAAGVSAVAVAEAFAPDDPTHERAFAALAGERGLPACASTELSGLYGLELRAVTAAINAAVLPVALHTADIVADGVAAAGIAAPVMVMRGDGGATDLDGFRRAPARTLYSGPAASVAGALRSGRIVDAVVVEIGGTSTNVAALHHGRPALSYVRVASHATALRALDVRVAGVAGGSMLRVRRGRVYGVGPRSAHIAGLPYACYQLPELLDAAEAVVVAPRPGDPADYLAVGLADGSLVALTTTCAANALGVVEPDDYAAGNRDAARAGFAAAGRLLRLAGDEVARRMLEAAGMAVAELVYQASAELHLRQPELVAVGGGAGGLGRHVAALLGLRCVVPDGAEVISSIGDALSLVRVERERTVPVVDPAVIDALVSDVEAEAVAAGAAPASLDVQVTEVPDRGALRAVATGAIGLSAGALPGRLQASEAAIGQLANAEGLERFRNVGAFWVAHTDGGDDVAVFDRFGDLAVRARGEVLVFNCANRTMAASEVAEAVKRHTRHRGPVTLRPIVWVLRGARLTELTSGDSSAATELLARAGDGTGTGTGDGGENTAVIVGRAS